MKYLIDSNIIKILNFKNRLSKLYILSVMLIINCESSESSELCESRKHNIHKK